MVDFWPPTPLAVVHAQSEDEQGEVRSAPRGEFHDLGGRRPERMAMGRGRLLVTTEQRYGCARRSYRAGSPQRDCGLGDGDAVAIPEDDGRFGSGAGENGARGARQASGLRRDPEWIAEVSVDHPHSAVSDGGNAGIGEPLPHQSIRVVLGLGGELHEVLELAHPDGSAVWALAWPQIFGHGARLAPQTTLRVCSQASVAMRLWGPGA